jgi:large subunit ribosomal protein L24
MIKKGDNVFVIAGKDRGKTGTVEKVIVKENKIVVIGVNMAKKHIKPSRKNPHGGIQDIARPIEISNLMVMCPHCGKPTKTGSSISEKAKERICKKCKGNLDMKDKNVAS